MDSTPASLLEQLRHSTDPRAWRRFVDLYSPLLFFWAGKMGLHGQNAADLVQEVFLVLVNRLPEFRYNPSQSFRSWLRTILVNKWRASRRRALERQPPGALPADLAAAGPDFADLFDEDEHRRYLIQRAVQLLHSDFQPTTWKAFWEWVVNGRSPAEVAAELGITIAAVYLAKARVLRRLREELAGLVD